MVLWRRFRDLASSAPAAVWGLVLVNLIPLVGVLFLGWDLLTILVLYWIESGIVGVINVFKIRRIQEAQRSGASQATEPPRLKRAVSAGTPIIPFFVFHYGLFWVVHGIFVFLIPVFASAERGAAPGLDYSRFSVPGVALTALGLAASHVISYWYNFIGRGEYLTTTADAQMIVPYSRVLVLHFTVLFGAVVVGLLGSPVALMALMVGVKILADLIFHVIERNRAAGRAGA
jgi:uncharacterized protein DUF6498